MTIYLIAGLAALIVLPALAVGLMIIGFGGFINMSVEMEEEVEDD